MRSKRSLLLVVIILSSTLFAFATAQIKEPVYQSYHFLASPVDTTPPYVKSLCVPDKNTVRITFDCELPKYNFSLDNVKLIGSENNIIFHTKYYNDGNKTHRDTVQFTTDDLKPNELHSITFEKIEDRFANVSAKLTIPFYATPTELDLQAPKILYISAPSNQEINIYFDEKIDKYPEYVYLKKFDQSTGKFSESPTDLPIRFKFVTSYDEARQFIYVSDNEGLENSHYKIFKLTKKLDLAGQEIATEADYFADIAGNKISFTEIPANIYDIQERTLISGTSMKNTAPELSYFTQSEPSEIEFTFNKNVLPVEPNPLGYNVRVAYGNKIIIRTEPRTPFLEGRKYNFNLTDFVKDHVGSRAKDLSDTDYDNSKSTEITTYMSDVQAPFLKSASAEHSKKISLEYNEIIETAGTYRIYYLDSNDKKVYLSGMMNFTTTSIDFDDLNGPKLELSKNYFLEVDRGAVDKSGNVQKRDSTISFIGTDIKLDNYFKGLKIISAKKIQIETSKNFNGVQLLEVNGDIETPVAIKTLFLAPTNVFVLEANSDMTSDKAYRVKVLWSNNQLDYNTYDFQGLLNP